MRGARPRAYSRRTSQGAQRRRRPQAAATRRAPGGWAPIPSLLVVDDRREIALLLAPRTRGPSPRRAAIALVQSFPRSAAVDREGERGTAVVFGRVGPNTLLGLFLPAPCTVAPFRFRPATV